MMKTIGVLLAVALAAAPAVRAQVPQMIAYQGRVTSGGMDFHGTGQFKFALVNGIYGGNPGETFALWTHDGTGSTLDPNVVPASSVAVVCDRGQYSVLLGNASAGMVPIPVSVFSWSDVRLRVWFNDGVHGFQKLSPDQRIVSAGYAMVAQQAISVPDGTITSAKLAKPVQSGSVASIPLTWDTATFSVTFPRPFTAAPAITLGVQSSDVALALATKPVITSATSGGFSAHVKVAAARDVTTYVKSSNREGFTAATLNGTPFYFYYTGNAVQIARYDAAGDFLDTPDTAGTLGNAPLQVWAASLALVNGNPAFAALTWNGSTTRLQFKRATAVDANGTFWAGAAVTALTPQEGIAIANPQLLVVNGAPAIFYADGDSVRMIRANDANGTTWGTPITVATDPARSVYEHTEFSAKVVFGQPAVAYHSTTGLRYVRATNASGTTWGASVLLDAASVGTIKGVSLNLTSGLPSVAYFDAKNAALKFIRSSDFLGGGWHNTRVTVASGVSGDKVTLISIGGTPAISTEQISTAQTKGIHLVRAKDMFGATWSAQVAVNDRRAQYSDVVLAAGQPGYFGGRSGLEQSGDFGLLYSPITVPTITWMAQAP